jgi:hypothetical protein
MLKVFAFLAKRQSIATQAFIEYYENNHVPLVLSLVPTPTVYKRNYVVRGDELNREDDTIDFDVVTELVFPDRDERSVRGVYRRSSPRYGSGAISSVGNAHPANRSGAVAQRSHF